MGKPAQRGLFVVVMLLLLWWGISASEAYSPLVLPSPQGVFLRLVQAFRDERLLSQILESLSAVGKGLCYAILLVMGMVLASVKSQWILDSLSAVCALFHPLPGIAILPVFMIWFGLGQGAVIAVIVHSVLWPLYTNMMTGVRSIPHIYEQVSRGYSITGVHKLFHITLPSVMPYLISGLRTGWARAWRALIGAEMVFGAVGNGGGMGWFIFKNRVFMDTEGMFAGLVVVICLGILVEKGIFDWIESKTLGKWGMIE